MSRLKDWTYTHPWTLRYLCVVMTADLIINIADLIR